MRWPRLLGAKQSLGTYSTLRLFQFRPRRFWVKLLLYGNGADLSGSNDLCDTENRMKSSVVLICVFCSTVASPQQASGTAAQMAIPGVKGIMRLDVGTTKFHTRVRPDGKEVQLLAANRPDGLEITAFLQQVAFPASPERCRDEWWPGTKNSVPLQRDGLQESVAQDGIARVEYIIPEFREAKVRQKNVHAYLGADNLCAEIHMSKAGFKTEDEKLFERVLGTVSFLPNQWSAESREQAPEGIDSNPTQQYFRQGSKFFLQQDYAASAEQYQEALDLEKQKRTLSKDLFRVLVDNLGMSYGISGKLTEAKATFDYGLTQDSEYPMFYYNLACMYGEMDKMNEAISQLRLAYKYKANMIAGETLPDPLQDDSFKRFVHNEEFGKAVHDMQH
jgi:tetratricopeptide (TPR) repeat protein